MLENFYIFHLVCIEIYIYNLKMFINNKDQGSDIKLTGFYIVNELSGIPG